MEFKKSENLSFGMELELQIVSQLTGTLSPSSLAFWDLLKDRPNAARYSLEATLATIELNTSVHRNGDQMVEEVTELTTALCQAAEPMGLLIRGGGTQLTQFWNERVMAPTPRAKELTKRFGFLPKRFSTYGMHVHIGAAHADDAIRMGNVLQALVPLFIAMSAASPFLQMNDTGFCASRPLEPLIYPHGGPMPRLKNWREMEAVAEEIFSTDLAQSLKDIYWDVRPKPEFGTIEVRVFDTPLSVHKAVALACWVRACADLALKGVLTLPEQPDVYGAQRVSRFLACRDGLDADIYDPFEQEWKPARGWMEALVRLIAAHHEDATDLDHIRALLEHCEQLQDAQYMRKVWTHMKDTQGSSPQAAVVTYSHEMAGLLLAPIHDASIWQRY